MSIFFSSPIWICKLPSLDVSRKSFICTDEKDEVRFRMLQNCAAQILSFQNIFRAEPIYKRLHPSLCSPVFRFVSRRQLPRRTWRFFVYLRHMYLQGVHQILFLFEYVKIYSGLWSFSMCVHWTSRLGRQMAGRTPALCSRTSRVQKNHNILMKKYNI